MPLDDKNPDPALQAYLESLSKRSSEELLEIIRTLEMINGERHENDQVVIRVASAELAKRRASQKRDWLFSLRFIGEVIFKSATSLLAPLIIPALGILLLAFVGFGDYLIAEFEPSFTGLSFEARIALVGMIVLAAGVLITIKMFRNR